MKFLVGILIAVAVIALAGAVAYIPLPFLAPLVEFHIRVVVLVTLGCLLALDLKKWFSL